MCAFRCPICTGRCDHLPPGEICNSGNSVDETIHILTQKNESLQTKITSLISIVKDGDIKSQLNTLLKDCASSKIDISRLQRIFQNIVQDYEQQLKQSEQNSNHMKSKYEKTKLMTNKMKSKVSGSKDLIDENNRLNKLLQESETAYKAKCTECTKLTSKLEKTKKKARQMIHQNNNKLQEFNDNEEIVERLHTQVDDLKSKLKALTQYKEQAEMSATDHQKQLIQKDYEIEDLKELLKKANESKPKQNLFQEPPFDFQNPFQGDLRSKFEKIKNMTQFESHQRVQLILNEASRELQITEKANNQLTNDLKEANEKINEVENQNNDTKATLHNLIAQLHQLEANERLLSDAGVVQDETLLKFIGSILPKDIPIADLDSLITRLSSSDKVASSLVNSLLLANTKQREQQQRLLNEIKERDEIIIPIRDAGIPPEEAVNLIMALRKKKNEYKKEVKNLHSTIDQLNQSIEVFEQEHEQMNQSLEALQNDLSISQDHIDLTENQKAEMEASLKEVNEKADKLQKEKDELAKQFDTLQAEKKVVDDELKRVQNELSSKTEAYAKLDVQYRMAKQAIKEKFIATQENQRLAEESARRKVAYLQKKHSEQMIEAQKHANAIKESSYRALDASYSQASDLKGMLREVLMKLEKVKADKTSLISENEKLRKQNNGLRKKLNEISLAHVKDNENYKYQIEHYEINDRTHRHIATKEITAAAVRERQRIMNIVARELGSPYNIEYFESDDEDSFILFIRKIRDDLKKLKIFQNSELNQK